VSASPNLAANLAVQGPFGLNTVLLLPRYRPPAEAVVDLEAAVGRADQLTVINYASDVAHSLP